MTWVSRQQWQGRRTQGRVEDASCSLCLARTQVHFHFSEPTAVKDEMHVGAAIYLSAISMLMGWDMADQVRSMPPAYLTACVREVLRLHA